MALTAGGLKINVIYLPPRLPQPSQFIVQPILKTADTNLYSLVEAQIK